MAVREGFEPASLMIQRKQELVAGRMIATSIWELVREHRDTAVARQCWPVEGFPTWDAVRTARFTMTIDRCRLRPARRSLRTAAPPSPIRRRVPVSGSKAAAAMSGPHVRRSRSTGRGRSGRCGFAVPRRCSAGDQCPLRRFRRGDRLRHPIGTLRLEPRLHRSAARGEAAAIGFGDTLVDRLRECQLGGAGGPGKYRRRPRRSSGRPGLLRRRTRLRHLGRRSAFHGGGVGTCARGGVGGDPRFPWSERELDDIEFMPANVWQGRFPGSNTCADSFSARLPSVPFPQMRSAAP